MARILIIEDEKLLNDAYCLILKKEGHTVASARDGQAGLELAQTFDPQIIMLDLLMPIMDGIEFLTAYQPKQKHPDCHIIILSNIDRDDNIQKAHELGASRYVLKAVTSPQQLAVLVNHIVKK